MSERREINPMLSPIPGYEFTASVWPLHCLNNNLINPVFISFSELGRQAGRAWGRTGNAGIKNTGEGGGRKPSTRVRIWEEFNGRDLPCEWEKGCVEIERQGRNLRVITSHRRTEGWTKGGKWSWGKAWEGLCIDLIHIVKWVLQDCGWDIDSWGLPLQTEAFQHWDGRKKLKTSCSLVTG